MAQCATTALAGAVPRPCVCGARGWFGGFGPVPGNVSLPFPPSRPACPALRVAGRPVRVSLTLARWYAIPRGLCVPRARSDCPSGSPRVPFACVCARAPAVSAPPPLGGVACAPRAVPELGAGRAVPPGPCPSACPAPVPCSVWRAWGGAVRSRFPRTWLGVVGVAEGRPRGGCLPLLLGASEVRRSPSADCPTTGRAVGVRYPRAVGAGVWVWGPNTVPLACTLCGGCVPRGWWGAVPLPGLGLCAPRGAGLWRSCAGGRAGGGGAARAPCPPFLRPGGPVGRGVALPRSVPLPSVGRQQSGCHWRRSGHGGRGPHTTPVRARPPSLGTICAASWRVGAGSPVPRGSCGSRRLGQGGGPCSGFSLGRGEGGPPTCLGCWGPGPPRLAGQWGRWGGGGRWRRGLPAPPLGGGPRFTILAPLLSSAHCPLRARSVRVPGPPRGGMMRGGPWTAPPGAPSDLNAPSALPEWAMVMGGVMGGAASILFWCAAVRRPPSAPGGRGVAPVALKLGGGSGGGGMGRPPHRPPPSRPVGRRPAIRCLRRASPGYTRAVGVAGRPGALSAARLTVTGSVWRGEGGGGGEPPRPSWRPRLPQAGPRRGLSVCAVLGAAGPPSVGSGQGGSVQAVHRGRLPRPRCPLTPPAAASSGGMQGRPLFGLPPSALGPEREGGGGGGGPLVPWSRPLTAEGGRPGGPRPGGRPGGPGPGGQPSAGGSHSSPAPLYLEPDPCAGPRWGPLSPLAVVVRRWPARDSREG